MGCKLTKSTERKLYNPQGGMAVSSTIRSSSSSSSSSPPENVYRLYRAGARWMRRQKKCTGVFTSEKSYLLMQVIMFNIVLRRQLEELILFSRTTNSTTDHR